MISAELATRVAEAWNATRPRLAPFWDGIAEEQRKRILAVAEVVATHERDKHKADLKALLACVEDALKGAE